MSTATLPLDKFWAWLMHHPNCILRAGTSVSVLYDDEDFYWHLTSEGPEALLVQIVRGKRLVAELLINPTQVCFVQEMPGETEGEFVFELISETDSGTVPLYFFVLSHGWEEEPTPSARRVH